MPGLQLASFWEGNRAELFATFVLSSVAAVVPVPRPMDFGIDLLCTMTNQNDHALNAGRAFGVQVKSTSDREAKYGGLNDKGKWKKYEIDWLFGQDQPLLLCVADISSWRVQLYSTSYMWWLKWKKKQPLPGQVILVPDQCLDDFQEQTDEDRYPRTAIQGTAPGEVCGDGYSYRVPLGRPMVDVFLKEQDAPEYRDQVRKCLGYWLEQDYRNIAHHKTEVPFIEEWMDWTPNVPPESPGRIWHYWSETPGHNVAQLLQAISPAVSSLLKNLDAQSQPDILRRVVPIADLVKEHGLLDPMGMEVLDKWASLLTVIPDASGEQAHG